MKLYHESDIAIELIDDRDLIEKSVSLNDDFFIPSCAKGIIKLVHKKSTGYDVGDVVYFDPKMMIELKELNLVVVDKKSILMKVEE